MTDKPILKAIQQLLELKPKKGVSYQEVAALLGVKRQVVLDYILKNKLLVTFDDSGRIRTVYPRRVEVEEIKKSGKVFWEDEIWYDTWALRYMNNPEAAKLEGKEWVGGYGDCTQMSFIHRTPENEAALRALGMVPTVEFDYDSHPATLHWEE